jgi:hypothetical protein
MMENPHAVGLILWAARVTQRLIIVELMNNQRVFQGRPTLFDKYSS